MPRRLPLDLGLVLLGVLLAGRAQAQTLELTPATGVERTNQSGVTADLGPDKVSRADCTRDSTFVFSLQAAGSGLAGYNVEVWAGTSCELADNRDTECGQVAASVEATDRPTVTVRVRDIIARRDGPWESAAPVDVCATSEASAPTPLTLHFLLRNDADSIPSGLAPPTYAVTYDMNGPDAPSGVSAGVGEGALVVRWEEPDNAVDVARYRLFCEPAGGSSNPDGGAGNAGTNDAGSGDAGADDAGTSDAGTSDAGTSTGTGDAGTSTSSCSSPTLIAGQPPPSSLACGDTQGQSTNAETGTLRNGVRYAVGVAAVDDYGNEGELSVVACAIPEPVTGFFEAYRDAGGEGGGGFCSFGARSAPGAAAALALVALGLVVRRRRHPNERPEERG